MWECKCFMYTYAHTLTLCIRLLLSDLIWSDLIWSDLIKSDVFIYIYIYIHIFWSYLILPDLILSVYPYGYRFEPLKYRWVPEDKMRVCVCIYICVCTPMRYWDLTITMIGVMRENINNTGPECSTKPKKVWGNWGPVRPR